MASVTERINQIKQPYGGYVKPSLLHAVQLPINEEQSLNENIHGSIVGLAVDYLTRLILGDDVEHAFKTSLEGLRLARNFKLDISEKELINLVMIKDLNDDSIFNACRLAYFDVWIRNPFNAFSSSFREVNPDKETINNIRIMVERNLHLFKLCGGVKAKGFTFEGGGYTNLVDSGDGDFIADDTIWEIKTIKSKPTNKHTLQLLMYWIMGKHSNQSIFDNINCIGIFNPRYNIVYKLKISDIPNNVIKEVEDDVIGYNTDIENYFRDIEDIAEGIKARLTGEDKETIELQSLLIAAEYIGDTKLAIAIIDLNKQYESALLRSAMIAACTTENLLFIRYILNRCCNINLKRRLYSIALEINTINHNDDILDIIEYHMIRDDRL